MAEQEPRVGRADAEEAVRASQPVRRVAALASLALGAPLAVAWAQDGGAGLSGAALLQQLRRKDLPLDEVATLVPLLQVEPLAIRLPASDALRERYLDLGKRHAVQCQGLARDLAKVAVATQREQLGKRGAESVDTWRKAALAISRRDSLTKEQIQTEIDPLLAQLEGLLWPTAAAMRSAAPELATSFTELQRQRDELARTHSQFLAATAGLELHPDAEKHFAKVPPPRHPAPSTALDDEWTVWTLLALPLSAREKKVLEANELLRGDTDPEEFAGTTALNRLRFLLGLPVLRLDDKLGKAARDHSSDMVTLGFFDHTSPVSGKRTPGDRAARFGTSAGAENIAAGHDTGAGAIRGWWYSPGHHRNMLGNHGRTGLGRHAQTWTQMFGG